MRKQAGVTLIELMAAITVGSIIMGLGLFAANQAMQTLKMETVKLNATQMMAAAQSFYESHCSDSSPPNPTITRLLNEEHLRTPDDRDNPFGSGFTARILWGSPSVIQVRATMDSGPSMEAYKYSLGATGYSGQNLYWQEPPRIHTRPMGTETMEFLHLHEETACR